MSRPMLRHERRRLQRSLKEKQKKEGLDYPPTFTLPNRKSDFETVAEEKEAVQSATEEKLRVYRLLLPGLLKRLGRISDPRNQRKVKYKTDALMLYGILMFALQMGSRRRTNREMTTPQLIENLQAVFPELTGMPHQDTLSRLLEKIDVAMIESIYIDLLKQLIAKKKFKHLLHKGRYLVAVDGTQKYVMSECADERYLRRRVPGTENEYQYYAYVLEAVLIFSNGMVLPLLSEFLENSPELERIENDDKWKQDCELKAFYRLAARLKRIFPRLRLTLLLDGLYANGPVMEICRRNRWGFAIVLKDGSLPTVWREAKGLMRLDAEGECRHEQIWRGRRQIFRWVNGIEYDYERGGRKKRLKVHLVTCEESWLDIDKNGTEITRTSRHAWILDKSITRESVHNYCNLAARKRWLHENNILKEKHQGYQYEHIFSYHWGAMRGYHYLMHIGRMLNEMAIHSVYLTEHVKAVGEKSFIRKFREAIGNRELDRGRLRRMAASPGQLRLIYEDNWKTSRQAA
jgi:hypothetical protein